jgi:hypothetical protein
MAREAKVLITSSNNAGAGIKSAINDLTSLESNSVRIAKKIQEAFTAVAVAAAAKQVVQFGIEAVKAFGEVERKMTQLKVALGGNDASFDRLNKHIQNLSRVTLDSKGDIQALVAQLAALGKSDKDIERISEAAVKLSNVTGVGLNEAMKQVNATFSGTAGQLSKLIPELGTMTKEQLAAGDAVDLLNQKFKDVSDSMAGGVSQSLKNLTDGFGDLKENIGEGLASVFEPMIRGINSVIEGWNSAFDSHKRYKQALLVDDKLAELVKNENKAKVEFEKARGLMATAQREAEKPRVSEDEKAWYTRMLAEAKATYENSMRAYSSASISRAEYESRLTGGASIDTPRISGIQQPDLSTGPGAGAKAGLGAEDWDSRGITIGEYNNFPMPLGPQESEHFYGEENLFPQDYAKTENPSGFSGGFDFMPELSQLFTGLTQSMLSAGENSTADGPLGVLGDALGPVIDMFGGLLGSLGSVQAIMDPIGTILGSMMEVLGPLIDEALAPLIDILKIFGKILAASLVPILNILTPVIKMVATVMDWFAKKVMVPAANFVIDIWNGIAKVLNSLLGWAGVNIGYAARIDPNSLSSGGDTGSGGSSGTGASYTGSQPIIFNFYNQGNVVGSGGLEELAEIIDGLIKRNARYA